MYYVGIDIWKFAGYKYIQFVAVGCDYVSVVCVCGCLKHIHIRTHTQTQKNNQETPNRPLPFPSVVPSHSANLRAPNNAIWLIFYNKLNIYYIYNRIRIMWFSGIAIYYRIKALQIYNEIPFNLGVFVCANALTFRSNN